MKINGMRMLVIIMLIGLIAGVLAGLFSIAIPQGNGDVMYMLLGVIAGELGHVLNSMFNKRGQTE